jgi:hypothetical protein
MRANLDFAAGIVFGIFKVEYELISENSKMKDISDVWLGQLPGDSLYPANIVGIEFAMQVTVNVRM